MSDTPQLRLNRRSAERLRDGHLWVYRSDLQPGSPGTDSSDGPAPGSLVALLDPTGRAIGTALYSSASQIAARLLSPDPSLTQAELPTLLQARVAEALALRRREAPLDAETTAQRLIFSEADWLPGAIADRYGDLVVLQLLTQGMAQPEAREAIVRALRAGLHVDGRALTIWERPDPRIAELEELPPVAEEPLFSTYPAGEAPTGSSFLLNRLHFSYDVAAGQKTGAFLDQRLNYAAAAEAVRLSGKTGRALDVCTYQGGFALHLAQVCGRVTGVDQSRAALETAERNFQANRAAGTLPALAAVDWLEADAFELLRALDDAAEPVQTTKGLGRRKISALPSGLAGRFDAIVLDPPAFAKSRRAVEGALRGYKELNLRALRLLAPGGTLVTCSCSHHVALEDFTGTVASAAADAGRRVQLLQVRAAAPDHPEILTLPETRYLKCLICRVL